MPNALPPLQVQLWRSIYYEPDEPAHRMALADVLVDTSDRASSARLAEWLGWYAEKGFCPEQRHGKRFWWHRARSSIRFAADVPEEVFVFLRGYRAGHRGMPIQRRGAENRWLADMRLLEAWLRANHPGVAFASMPLPSDYTVNKWRKEKKRGEQKKDVVETILNRLEEFANSLETLREN